MAANHVSFGPDLVGCFKTFDSIKPNSDLTLHRWATRSLFQSQQPITHWSHRWGVMAALQTMWALAQIWLDASLNFWQDPAKWVTWLGRDGPSGAYFTTKITHWSHMEDMEWSNSNRWGDIAALQTMWALVQIWLDNSKLLTGPSKKVTWLGRDGPLRAYYSQLNITHWSHM
jgi:hypothetical protein